MKKIIFIILSIIVIGSFAACTSSDSEQEAAPPDNSINKSAAVVYFSATGNTKKVANTLANVLGVDAYEIIPTNKYTSEDLDYRNDDCRANREQNDELARPEISNDLSGAVAEETIYIGYPIWWGTNPKIIQTFLDKYDLSGKTVYLFCTSGSSGIEESVSDLQNSYTDVKIVSGQRFDSDVSNDDIVDWVKGLNQ